MTTLSLVSLITSSSYSFHPMIDSSMRTSPTGEASRAYLIIPSNSSRLYAMLAPVPPRVNEALIMAGKPMCSMACIASANEWTYALFGISRSILCIASLKSSLSSALLMAWRLAPISFTPYLSRTPLSARDLAVFKAV